MPPCTWCGATDHAPYQHGALVTRPSWADEPYPFMEPRLHAPAVITLTQREIEAAERRAEKVMAENDKRGYKMYFEPMGETRLEVNVRGFGAELAARRATGLALDWKYLPTSYRRKEKPPDLGQRTEVRNAKKADGFLYATKRDPITRVFLLVTGTMPTFTVRGWVEGIDLMVPERWVEPPQVPRGGGFRMRASELNPLPLPEDA